MNSTRTNHVLLEQLSYKYPLPAMKALRLHLETIFCRSAFFLSPLSSIYAICVSSLYRSVVDGALDKCVFSMVVYKNITSEKISPFVNIRLSWPGIFLSLWLDLLFINPSRWYESGLCVHKDVKGLVGFIADTLSDRPGILTLRAFTNCGDYEHVLHSVMEIVRAYSRVACVL